MRYHHPIPLLLSLLLLLSCEDAEKKAILDLSMDSMSKPDQAQGQDQGQDQGQADLLIIDQGIALHLDLALDQSIMDQSVVDALGDDLFLAPKSDEQYIDDLSDASALGQYQIGYVSLEMTYELPMDLAQALNDQVIEQPAQTTRRSLRLGVWYPAIVDQNTPFARYPLLANRRAAYDHPPIADVNHKFPLYVYSHGAKVWPELGAFQMEFLASHGWVAVGIEHRHDQIQTAALPRPDAMYLLRPMDVQRVIDYLLSDQSDALIRGRISESFIMAGGHSYGGYTTLSVGGATYQTQEIEGQCADFSDQFCMHWPVLKPYFENGFLDARIKLTVPQSAGDFKLFKAGVQAISLPTLLITAQRDLNCTEEGSNLPYWNMLSQSINPEQKYHLSFAQAGHASLTLTCEHLPGVELNNGCGMDFTPAQELQQISNRYMLTFARAYLGEQALDRETLNTAVQNDVFLLESARE
jgi:predicted dienelactone hydrolase